MGEQERFKYEARGITLVALVITIIIIIILATITINMAFGDNGLIKQAEIARDLTANSTEYETQATANLMEYMNEMLEEEGTNLTDIYVFLYDDGTLTFGTQNEQIEEKTVVKQYGNIKGQEYSSWIEEDDSRMSSVPWFNEANQIKKVSITDEIVPLSMAS